MNLLLVDDAKVLRINLKNSINEFRHNPIDVFYEAGDGEEALRFIKIHEIDFIFLDLNMPDLNGLEVLKTIRENVNNRNIPVVIITGDDKEKTILDANDAGVVDFIVKPPDKDKIKAILGKIKK